MKLVINTTFDRIVLGKEDSYLGFYILENGETTFIPSSSYKNASIIKELKPGDSIKIEGSIKTRKIWVPIVEKTPHSTGEGEYITPNIISYFINYLQIETIVKVK